jgi:FHA domain-containing protein
LEATLTSSLGRTTLGSDTLTIGRASDNQLIIDDPQASAHHAEIKLSPDRETYLVTDQSSTNGTFVNEERLPIYTSRTLNTGDVIRIGSLLFTYEMTNMANPYEPTIAASPPDHEPTVAATPDAIPSPSVDTPEAQSPQSLPASTNYSPPPSAYPPSAPDQLGVPQQRKRRIGLWITLAFVAGLVIAGSAWGILYYVNRSTPTKTLQAFCTTFKNGDAQGFYDLLSRPVQAQTSLDNLKAYFGLIQSAGGIRDCTVSNVQESGSTATGNVTITRNDGRISEPLPVRLVNEGGTWKLGNTHSL